VKRLVVIGEAKKKMGQAFKGVIPTEEAASLKEAIQKAFDSASKGDCVLLSPMCSSFDMFANYEERGRLFKQTVSELARTNN
jgi:UDP-N-acetylmuramoylalanine--D-glutamate ligase